MADITYLIWSNKHSAWLGDAGWGYFQEVEAAGRYTEAEAVDIVLRSALSGDKDKVSFMVAAPGNWGRP